MEAGQRRRLSRVWRLQELAEGLVRLKKVASIVGVHQLPLPLRTTGNWTQGLVTVPWGAGLSPELEGSIPQAMHMQLNFFSQNISL